MENIKNKKAGNFVQSVERALDILEILARYKKDLRVTDLAKEMSLGITTVHNLLKTLVYRNYVEKDVETLKYKLGKRSFYLSQYYSKNDKLISLAKQPLERLNKTSHDLVFLCVLHNHELAILITVESDQALLVNPIGAWQEKLHCTAAGEILLAYCSEEKLKTIINKHGLLKFTQKTITDYRKLKIELKKVREQGYSISKDEDVMGVSAIGAPIRDDSGKVIAAISTSMPTIRMKRPHIQKTVKLLQKTALEISSDLGFSED